MELLQVKHILDQPGATRALHFTRRTGAGYMSYSPEVSEAVMGELTRCASDYLNQYMDLEQIEFNPTGCRDGTIEICDFEYVGDYHEVINSFDVCNIENIEDHVDNFSFYCIDIDYNGINVKLLRRVTKFKRLYSRGILAAFQGNRLNKIEDKMLGLDGSVDLIVFNNEIAIINHTALERIFKLSNQYSVKATEAIEFIRRSDGITNFDAFEEDCLTDLRIQKVLTKMLKEGNQLDACFDQFDNIVETINIFDLDIEVQTYPERKIIYEDKKQVMDILRIIRDSYYKSIIREQLGVDNKI